MPKLYIIAGCNGAGKTTASYTILPEFLDCKEFVNAEEIAKGLSPFQPEKVVIEAGRVMLARINTLIKSGVNFAFETTLSTKSYVNLIKKAKLKGFQVTLLFFWLRSKELAISRVKNRVIEGGHNVPENVIKRRYDRGLINLFNLFIPIIDEWALINNSGKPYQTIAYGTSGEIKITDIKIWEELQTNYYEKH